MPRGRKPSKLKQKFHKRLFSNMQIIEEILSKVLEN